MVKRQCGFTLIEVLIALAITAFVGSIAYASLSSVLLGVEGSRVSADRTHEVNRAWMLITRDLRQFSPRPVRDEFGEEEPAMIGGELARFPLSFTRAGWHNPLGQQRSSLQRVNYVVEDNALWRESYAVLDRASNTVATRVKLLDGVDDLELGFLSAIGAITTLSDQVSLDTGNWAENWIVDTSSPGGALVPPAALELRLRLEDLGEIRRLYALPPF